MGLKKMLISVLTFTALASTLATVTTPDEKTSEEKLKSIESYEMTQPTEAKKALIEHLVEKEASKNVPVLDDERNI